MSERRTKSYTLDGKRYRFDNETLKRELRLQARRLDENLTSRKEALASAVPVSPKTVDAWLYGQNGPVDVGIVERIARFLGISKESLLKEVEAEPMTKLTASQRDAVARVYSEVSDFLYMLDVTDGCVWHAYSIQPGSLFSKYLTPTPDIPAGKAMTLGGESLALAGYRYALHALFREWPFLGSHPIYDELLAFMDGPMDDVWAGAGYPDCRFGCDEERIDRPSTSEVDKAIRDVISKYSA